LLARASVRTHLDQLRRLDLPAVLEMFHPSRRDTCFLALLRLDGASALVAVGQEPEMTVPTAQLDALWTRNAVLTWPEAEDLRGDRVRRTAWARETLGHLGFGDADLQAAVSRFQADTGLVPDGLLGPRTRMALFALSPGPRPRLSGNRGAP
jgi:hypothetical protein